MNQIQISIYRALILVELALVIVSTLSSSWRYVSLVCLEASLILSSCLANFSGKARTSPGYLEALDGALGLQIAVAILGGYGLKSYTFFALFTMFILFEWYLFVQIKAVIIRNLQSSTVPATVPMTTVQPSQEVAA